MEGMEAYVLESYGALEAPRRREIPRPQPQGEEVRVKVRVVGSDRADLLERDGAIPGASGITLPRGAETGFGGVVEAAGGAAGPYLKELGLSLGSPVMGLLSGGAYAQFVVTHPASFTPFPRASPLPRGPPCPRPT